MFTKYQFVFIITTLIHIYSADAEKFRYCAVNGKTKKASIYCPILNQPDSQVKCVLGVDRLDCLRKISKKQADFAVFTAEDLVTADKSSIEILVTNELRFTQDNFEYEVVVIFDKRAKITSKHDLQDKRLCHPGYGYKWSWTKIFSNYLESLVVPQGCEPTLTLTENRIKSSSEYFGAACKAGPWVDNSTLDYQLKSKYPNLCASCDNPYRCSKQDKYWGRTGPLLCLTDGAGDVALARWDDAQAHFGLDRQKSEISPDDYSLLCPDDTTKPVNTTKPCVWVVKPWSVVASERTKAQDVQALVSTLGGQPTNSWQSTLVNLMETYHLYIQPLNPIEPIASYLAKATGFLSANSFPGCHPPRTIRICTTSIIENSKCSWLREVTSSYGVEPDLDCLKADNIENCLDAIQKNFADISIIEPDLLNRAQSKFDLKTIFYETADDNSKYLTVAVVKKDSAITSFEDMRGLKACFPTYDGIAWNTAAYTLNRKGLSATCPFGRLIEEYFGRICVADLGTEIPTQSGLKNCTTKGDESNSAESDTIDCLLDGTGEVAFLSKNNLKSYLLDGKKNKKNLTLSDFKFVCEDSNDCHLSWAPLGYGVVRKNSSDLWVKDALDVFLSADDLFGNNYESLTSPFTLFGSFNGKRNLLFHDATIKLRSQPTVKNFDQMLNIPLTSKTDYFL